MIGRLTGRIALKAPPQLLLDVNGVGYELEAPMSTFYNLPAAGESVVLFTHITVREDAHLLYGFGSLPERSLFRELIKLSGIGPKLGLAVLSGISVEDFWLLVRSGDAARLTQLPGIGKKTAERMILELKGKAGASDAPAAGSTLAAPAASPLAEARSALEALGYKPVEAARMTEAFTTGGLGTDQIIREALKRALR